VIGALREAGEAYASAAEVSMDYFFERVSADLHAPAAPGNKNRMRVAVVLRGGSHRDRPHRAVPELNRGSIHVLDLFKARTKVFANCHDAFRPAAEKPHHVERMDALAQEHPARTAPIASRQNGRDRFAIAC